VNATLINYNDNKMATGGTASVIPIGNGQYEEVHVFTTTGTAALTVNRTPAAGSAKVLVVAGGGGGGMGGVGTSGGGGGGAGGLIMNDSFSLTASTYTITVGAGGPGGNICPVLVTPAERKAIVEATYNGSDSKITGAGINLTAKGGGGGAWHVASNTSQGGDGGSGGASFYYAAGTGVGEQGHSGAVYDTGGKAGGGGYTSAGRALTFNTQGNTGGAGLAKANIPAAAGLSDIPAMFAEGGNGSSPVAGIAGSGNGGGGGLGSNGEAGGSGIVIVRFPWTAP
jgi:hypothetical protein